MAEVRATLPCLARLGGPQVRRGGARAGVAGPDHVEREAPGARVPGEGAGAAQGGRPGAAPGARLVAAARWFRRAEALAAWRRRCGRTAAKHRAQARKALELTQQPCRTQTPSSCCGRPELRQTRESASLPLCCSPPCCGLAAQILVLRELIRRGLAVHHAGLLPVMKEAVEMLFCQGYIKVRHPLAASPSSFYPRGLRVAACNARAVVGGEEACAARITCNGCRRRRRARQLARRRLLPPGRWHRTAAVDDVVRVWVLAGRLVHRLAMHALPRPWAAGARRARVAERMVRTARQHLYCSRVSTAAAVVAWWQRRDMRVRRRRCPLPARPATAAGARAHAARTTPAGGEQPGPDDHHLAARQARCSVLLRWHDGRRCCFAPRRLPWASTRPRARWCSTRCASTTARSSGARHRAVCSNDAPPQAPARPRHHALPLWHGTLWRTRRFACQEAIVCPRFALGPAALLPPPPPPVPAARGVHADGGPGGAARARRRGLRAHRLLGRHPRCAPPGT